MKVMKSECPFCDPNVIENQHFLSDKYGYAVVSIAPLLEGHSLVISKAHKPNGLELSLEEVYSLAALTQVAKQVLYKVYGTIDFTEVVQDGKHAYQTVPHFHRHIYPRQENDVEKSEFYQRTVWSRIEWESGKGLLSSHSLSAQVMRLREAAQGLESYVRYYLV